MVKNKQKDTIQEMYNDYKEPKIALKSFKWQWKGGKHK